MTFASPRTLSVLATLLLAGATVAHAADPYALAPPYAVPMQPGFIVTPLVTTGQQVQLTGAAPGTNFRFLGIPDGIGAYSPAAGQLTMYVNHEFTKTSSTPAGPLASGARITELTLNVGGGSANVVSARNAIQNVYAGEPSVPVAPGTSAFARFCSGYLGGPWSGLDTPIYFCGEETGGAATFDGLGGSAVALVNGDLYQLPRMGHANWENVVVLPSLPGITALLGGEDGSTLNSQLYLYLGSKVPGHPNAITRNGLDNGQLYVMVWGDAARHDEATFTVKGTSVPVHFAPVNYNQPEGGLETQSQAVGSFNFIRVEDIAYDKTVPGVAYFVTTGTPGTANPFGRLYRLDYNPANPAAAATLTLLLDGSEGIVSPDNIDINAAGELMICEDPNYNLSLAPLFLTRDTHLWRYRTSTGVVDAILQLDRAGAKSHALAADPLNTNVAGSDTPGGWEFSGVIDASAWTGPGSWILDVQAHSLRINPSSATVEGGQVMLLTLNAATPTQDATSLQGGVVDTRVELVWASANRSRVSGFRVERASSEAGPWGSLSEETLPSSAEQYVDEPGTGDWYYRVVSLLDNGQETVSPVYFARVGAAGSATIEFATPSPNPGSRQQTLRFRLPASLAGTHVDLSVFDVTGRKVATLYSDAASTEEVTLQWDGRDDAGRATQGMMFARLQTSQGVKVQRVLRVR